MLWCFNWFFLTMIPIFRHVIGIDIDSQSLDIASTNAEDMEVCIWHSLIYCQIYLEFSDNLFKRWNSFFFASCWLLNNEYIMSIFASMVNLLIKRCEDKKAFSAHYPVDDSPIPSPIDHPSCSLKFARKISKLNSLIYLRQSSNNARVGFPPFSVFSFEFVLWEEPTHIPTISLVTATVHSCLDSQMCFTCIFDTLLNECYINWWY